MRYRRRAAQCFATFSSAAYLASLRDRRLSIAAERDGNLRRLAVAEDR